MGNTWIIDFRAYLTPAGALTANLPVRPRLLADPAADEHDRIHWYCPVCHDNGWISGWQNSFWDGSAEPLSTS